LFFHGGWVKVADHDDGHAFGAIPRVVEIDEAVALGLPIIGTTGGAIPDTVPSDAGLLVPPGDLPELAKALRRIIGDSDLRQRLKDGARAAALQLPTWRQSAEIFALALERLA
jgi:glycosyltransferase involved in cell wall biosynthesis